MKASLIITIERKLVALVAFVTLLITTLSLSCLSYAEDQSAPSVTTTEQNIEETTVDLGPDTKWVRDVEVIQGTLNKKTTIVTHVLNVITPGTLDIEITYNGKHKPLASISGLNFNGETGSFTVEPANYVLIISSTSGSNTSYAATITYPEREVPLDVPLGSPEVITYDDDNNILWYLYFIVTLIIFATIIVLIKKGKLIMRKM
ncbi:MAG TPA: hypothetical protein VLS94_10990 [Fusibacter sp.]|nr:hypothetical protein [Fusibacter sp.]